MRPCTRTMASKKFITWGFLFILMFLLASEAASRKVLETFELGNSSNSAFILGFYFQFASLYYSHLIKVNRVKKKMKLVKLICFKAIFWWCRTMSYVILFQNQLVMRKTHLNLLWHSTSRNAGLFLGWL